MNKSIKYVICLVCIILLIPLLILCIIGVTDSVDKADTDNTLNSSTVGSTDLCRDVKPGMTILESDISNSTCAIRGEFIKVIKDINYTDDESLAYDAWEFKNNEVIYGYAPEETVEVIHLESMDIESFVPGEEYLLVLDRFDSIHFDRGAKYRILCEAVINLTDINKINFSDIYGYVKIDAKDDNEVIDYFKEIEENVGHRKQNLKKIFRNTDISEVAKNCEIIVKLMPKGILVESNLGSANTYICLVSDVLKGEDILIHNENIIYASLTKDSVEIGKEYYVMLSTVDETSIIYEQSSKESVIPTEYGNVEEQIKTWLSETE